MRNRLIYLGAPMDFAVAGGHSDRADFVDAVVGFGNAVYDATTAFHADPGAVNVPTGEGIIDIHFYAIEVAAMCVFDLRQRSVGVPVEMDHARQSNKPILALVNPDDRPSLYIRTAATEIFTGWQSVAEYIATLWGRAPR